MLLADVETGFQSTHPNVGCDPIHILPVIQVFYFNPRIPMWDATQVPECIQLVLIISIHASQCGMRLCSRCFIYNTFKFQSTHPNVGCDINPTIIHMKLSLFQSTHPNVGCDCKKKQNLSLNFTLLDKFILSYSQNYDN